MYGLLVVDDDKLVRDVLSTKIDWKKLDVELIGTVSDGIKALEFCKIHKPDIMITDVRMPRMDGLQLVSELGKINTSVHTIMISGYGEFDYVKEAMKLGAKDYLLKPYSEEELIHVVKSIVDQMKKEQSEMSWQIHSSRHYLIKEIIEGRIRPLANNKVLKHIFGDNWVELPNWRVALIVLDDYKRIMRDEKEIKRIEFAVDNILEELVREYTHNIYGRVEEGKWAVVFHTDSWNVILNHIRLGVHTNANVTVSISLSEVVPSVEALAEGFKQAYEHQEYRCILGADRIITKRDIAEINMASPKPSGAQSQLLELVIEGKPEQLQSVFEQLANEAASLVGSSIRKLHEIMFEMMIQLQYALVAKGITIEFNEHHPLKLWREIEVFEVNVDLFDFIRRYLLKMAVQYKEIKKIPSNLYIKNAVEYTQRNYHKDISLTHVAESLQISPNYLSNLFKKELGTTFLEMLTDARIKKAKELLKTTSMKNYEVCEIIGYQSPEYFTKVFKKYTGQSPFDYRNDSS